MTIREKLYEHLTKNGLWPHEANSIIETYRDSEQSMTTRMSDKITDYPQSFLAVLFLSIDHEAIKWIDANKPQHFARPMFSHERGLE